MIAEQLRELRDQGAGDIRVHGNGFIQLDLDERRRLHVWGHPDVPRQMTPTPIHDHVFGFHSRILVGRLVNVVYYLDYSSRAFTVYEPSVRHGEDTVLEKTHVKCAPRVNYTDMLLPKSPHFSEYNFHLGVFHEMFAPEPSVTIMVKHGPTLAQNPDGLKPRVLVPVGVEPDNEFDRYDNNPSHLWDIIYEMLNL